MLHHTGLLTQNPLLIFFFFFFGMGELARYSNAGELTLTKESPDSDDLLEKSTAKASQSTSSTAERGAAGLPELFPAALLNCHPTLFVDFFFSVVPRLFIFTSLLLIPSCCPCVSPAHLLHLRFLKITACSGAPTHPVSYYQIPLVWQNFKS